MWQRALSLIFDVTQNKSKCFALRRWGEVLRIQSRDNFIRLFVIQRTCLAVIKKEKSRSEWAWSFNNFQSCFGKQSKEKHENLYRKVKVCLLFRSFRVCWIAAWFLTINRQLWKLLELGMFWRPFGGCKSRRDERWSAEMECELCQ